MTQGLRGREEISHADRAQVRIDLADNFPDKCDWCATEATPTIKHNTRPELARPRKHADDAPIIGDGAGTHAFIIADHKHVARTVGGWLGDVKLLRTVGGRLK